MRVRRWLAAVPVVPVFLLGVLAPWMKFWDPAKFQHQWDGVATLAWLGVLLAIAATADRATWTPRPLSLPAWAWALLLGVGGAAGVGIGLLRQGAGLVGNELFLFPPASMGVAEIYLWDMGLPSLLHNVPLLVLRHVGGVTSVTALHAATHALTLLGVVVLVRRTSTLGAALATAAVLGTLDVWLFQVAELRAYATYLMCATWGVVGVVPDDDGRTRPGLAVAGFALAALDTPSMAVPLGALLVALVVARPGVDVRSVLLGGLRAGDAHTRAQRGVLLALAGLVPVSIASRGLHHVSGGVLLYLNRPVVVGELVLWLACAGWLLVRRPAWRPLVLVSLGLLLTPILLVLAGMLRDDAKYLLVGLPAACAVVLGALFPRDASAWRGAVAALFVLVVAAVHRPWTPSVPYPWDLPLEAWAGQALGVGLGSAAVVGAALWVAGRRTAALWPAVVALGVYLAGWQAVRAYALAFDLAGAGAACDAAEGVRVASHPDAALCGSGGEWLLRCQARAIHQQRTRWTDPMLRDPTDPALTAWREPCPSDRPTLRLAEGPQPTFPAGCTTEAVWRAGDVVASATTYTLARCPAGR